MKRIVITTVILTLSLLPFPLHSSVDQTTTERIINKIYEVLVFLDDPLRCRLVRVGKKSEGKERKCEDYG